MPSNSTERVFNIEVNYNDAIAKIAELRGRLQEVTETQKGFAKSLKEGTLSQEEYNKAMAESKLSGDTLRAALRDVEKATRNQIKAEQEAQGSLKALRAELANATTAYDSMSRAEREGAAGKALQKHINEITTEVKNAEEATQRYSRNVGNYENAIKNALGINSRWANSLLALGKEVQSAGGFMNVARGQVQALSTTMTGLLANPVFLALAGIAGAGVAFKWWVDYNSGLEEASRLTEQFTGKEGAAMQEYRNTVSAVADTFDKDFKEVLNAADALAAQFGIDADEALDIIKDGFVAGADAQGTFLQSLQQYPAAFREAGVSADEFTAIVAQTKSGIFDEAGLDAIKQANSRIRQMSTTTAASLEAIGIDARQVTADLTDGTRTTFDVLQEVSSRLATLPPSSQEVGNALVNVFGRQGRDAGLAMIETLSSLDTSLETVKASTGELGTLQERAMAANIDLQNAMSSLFDATGGTFEGLKTSVSVFIKEGLATFLNYVKQGIDYVKDLYKESAAFRAVVAGIGTTFKNMWNIVKGIFSVFGTTVRSVATLVKGIFTLDWGAIKSAFTDGLNGLFESVRTFVSDSIKEVGRFFGVVRGGGNKETTTTATGAATTGAATAAAVAETAVADEVQTVAGGGRTTSAADAAKKELQLVRAAEDEMIKVIRDSRMKQQLEVQKSYDRQIEDLQRQLTEEKDLTVAGREALNVQIRMLEQQRNDALDALGEDELQNEIAQERRLIELRLENVRAGSEEEYNLRLRQNEILREQALADDTLTDEMRIELQRTYDTKRQELLLEAVAGRHSAEMEATEDDERERLELEMALQQERIDALFQFKDETDEEYKLRQQELYDELLAMQEAYVAASEKKSRQEAEEERKIQQTRMQSYRSVYGGIIDVMGALGEENTALAKLSKVLAIGQIAVDTGVAMAEGIRQAQSVPFPANIAAIATTIAAILAGITSAISSVNSASFAEGGLVVGAGTGTSDSITARLSNGESVITARATQMFAPLLSSINQMGGGVPIDVAGTTTELLGDDYLSEGLAASMAELHPVVTVEDINKVSNRVSVVETRGAW